MRPSARLVGTIPATWPTVPTWPTARCFTPVGGTPCLARLARWQGASLVRRAGVRSLASRRARVSRVLRTLRARSVALPDVSESTFVGVQRRASGVHRVRSQRRLSHACTRLIGAGVACFACRSWTCLHPWGAAPARQPRGAVVVLRLPCLQLAHRVREADERPAEADEQRLERFAHVAACDPVYDRWEE